MLDGYTFLGSRFILVSVQPFYAEESGSFSQTSEYSVKLLILEGSGTGARPLQWELPEEILAAVTQRQWSSGSVALVL